jgi:hypothetical protein
MTDGERDDRLAIRDLVENWAGVARRGRLGALPPPSGTTTAG